MLDPLADSAARLERLVEQAMKETDSTRVTNCVRKSGESYLNATR